MTEPFTHLQRNRLSASSDPHRMLIRAYHHQSRCICKIIAFSNFEEEDTDFKEEERRGKLTKRFNYYGLHLSGKTYI